MKKFSILGRDQSVGSKMSILNLLCVLNVLSLNLEASETEPDYKQQISDFESWKPL